MKIWKKTILFIAIAVSMAGIAITEYHIYDKYLGTSSSIGPSMNQVYLDFEFDLYRASNGILLLNDHVIKKEVIADDRVRFELLVDYKKNPLAFLSRKMSNKQQKLGSKLNRRIIYYRMVNKQWIKSNI